MECEIEFVRFRELTAGDVVSINRSSIRYGGTALYFSIFGNFSVAHVIALSLLLELVWRQFDANRGSQIVICRIVIGSGAGGSGDDDRGRRGRGIRPGRAAEG